MKRQYTILLLILLSIGRIAFEFKPPASNKVECTDTLIIKDRYGKFFRVVDTGNYYRFRRWAYGDSLAYNADLTGPHGRQRDSLFGTSNSYQIMTGSENTIFGGGKK
jgi:hypothetical protein